MLFIRTTPEKETRNTQPAGIDPETIQRVKAVCESTKAELSEAVKGLNNTSDFKQIELKNRLTAAIKTLSGIMGTIEIYFSDEN